MDILVSSNLERLIFHLWVMIRLRQRTHERLNTQGQYELTDSLMQRFWSSSQLNMRLKKGSAAEIKRVYESDSLAYRWILQRLPRRTETPRLLRY